VLFRSDGLVGLLIYLDLEAVLKRQKI
jgi:hypothetical protein